MQYLAGGACLFKKGAAHILNAQAPYRLYPLEQLSCLVQRALRRNLVRGYCKSSYSVKSLYDQHITERKSAL